MARPQECPCGSGKFPEPIYDGYNIFMCYACDVLLRPLAREPADATQRAQIREAMTVELINDLNR